MYIFKTYTIYIYICIQYMCIYIHAHTHIYIYICVHVYTHKCIHYTTATEWLMIPWSVDTYTHRCMYVYIYIYTHLSIYTHTLASSYISVEVRIHSSGSNPMRGDDQSTPLWIWRFDHKIPHLMPSCPWLLQD